MSRGYPFVVAVVSEKGGVGKTTIATNLAVFLKALREDLPVTVASFDNHFSVDQMFAIDRHLGKSVADLFAGVPAGELALLGEYGVQFLASDRNLTPPDEDPGHLRRVLGHSDLPGILILDTRPVLDYFSRNALLAADLVLVPVKDRPSLVNVASIQRTMTEAGGDPERLWVVPSLVDQRLKLREGIGIREFLVATARDRGYQVTETFIVKSPRVEGLITSLSSRIYPVLTHARQTAAYGQFKELADFVLQRFDATPKPVSRQSVLAALLAGEIPPGRLRRLAAECPLCSEAALGDEGHFFQDLRTRRYGFVHAPCLKFLLDGTGLADLLTPEGVLAVEAGGAGGPAGEPALHLHLFEAAGEAVAEEVVPASGPDPWTGFLQRATGRSLPELYRDVLLLTLDEEMPARHLAGEGHAAFSRLRRQVAREILGKA